MENFILFVVYAFALLFALAMSDVLPGFPPTYLQSSSLLVLRIVAACILLFIAVSGELLSGAFEDPRSAGSRHAGLVFILLFLISWLVYINVSGDGFHQPSIPNGPYSVRSFSFGSAHYLTPFQAEVVEVTRWTMLIGLGGRLVTDWRRRARRRERA